MAFKPGDVVKVIGSSGLFKFSFHLSRIRFIHRRKFQLQIRDIIVGKFNYRDFVEVWLPVFRVGDEVEVMGTDGINKFYYYRARVVNMHGEIIEVEYHNKFMLNGVRLTEAVDATQVRPTPDATIGNFTTTDFVDVWVDGGWWGGIVLGGNQQSAIVYFAYKPIGDQHMIIPKEQIRIHQKWSRCPPYGMWMYRKRLM